MVTGANERSGTELIGVLKGPIEMNTGLRPVLKFYYTDQLYWLDFYYWNVKTETDLYPRMSVNGDYFEIAAGQEVLLDSSLPVPYYAPDEKENVRMFEEKIIFEKLMRKLGDKMSYEQRQFLENNIRLFRAEDLKQLTEGEKK